MPAPVHVSVVVSAAVALVYAIEASAPSWMCYQDCQALVIYSGIFEVVIKRIPKSYLITI